MEFWGVEVPAGKPLTCEPGDESYVHVSQAALGESEDVKSNERVVLKVTVGKTEVVVGTLSQGKCDQTPLDLIFDDEFTLSHNSASCSVFFCGYKIEAAKGEFPDSSSDEDIPEPVSIPVKANGKSGMKTAVSDKTAVKEHKIFTKETKTDTTEKPAVNTTTTTPKVDAAKVGTKPEATKGKPKAKQEDIDDEEDDDEEDEDDNEDEDEEDDDEDDQMDEDLSDEDDLEYDEEDEGKKDESGDEELKSAAPRKRVVDNLKAFTPSKKMKLTTPIQGESGTGDATEYWRKLILAGKGEESAVKKREVKSPITPASATKQQTSGQNAKLISPAKKTPAKGNTSPQSQPTKGAKSNTPASGKKIGQYVCKTCDRNFVSESALTQHNAAKHTK